MMKKIFILIALLNLLYSSQQCNTCYFPKQLYCPAECSVSVPCSTPQGSGYECVDFKGVKYTQNDQTISINFYSTSSCTSPPEASQQINAIPPGNCEQDKCYSIDDDCAKVLLALASNFPSSHLEILLPTEIITTSLLIICVEVFALAIVYAIGKAFSYEKLVTYSKGEYTQALANIILIALISSFLFGTNIYGIIQSLQFQLQTIAWELVKYASKIFVWNGYVSTLDSLAFEATAKIPIWVVIISFGIKEIQLIDGIAPYLDVIDRLIAFFSDAYIFILATQIFLNFIVEMFPILLYLGLLLRVIPWGRSAGGYLIAFFIVFYFFYPFLLSFFFSLNMFKKVEFGANTSLLNYILPLPSVPLLESFSVDFLNVVIKYILPIALCFIVSLMLVEEFGMILGSFLTRPTLFRLI
jgi:hypothetical protein